MGLLTDAVVAEVGIKVGAVDVDFAADLGEGDDALVAVVLPCLGLRKHQSYHLQKHCCHSCGHDPVMAVRQDCRSRPPK